MKKLILLVCVFLACSPVITHAETPDDWVTLGHRIHGEFGTYIALGIRVGLDARQMCGRLWWKKEPQSQWAIAWWSWNPSEMRQGYCRHTAESAVRGIAAN